MLSELHPVRANWYKIGLQLNIPYTTLDCFKQNYSDQSDLMCEMLKHWLKTVVDPPLSWEAVVTALRSPAVIKMRSMLLSTWSWSTVQLVMEEFHSPTKVEISEGILSCVLCRVKSILSWEPKVYVRNVSNECKIASCACWSCLLVGIDFTWLPCCWW